MSNARLCPGVRIRISTPYSGRTEPIFRLASRRPAASLRENDVWCSLAVGQRYLALLEKTHAPPARIGRAALANARLLRQVHDFGTATALLQRALAALFQDTALAGLRADMHSELEQVRRHPPTQAEVATLAGAGAAGA